MCTFLCPFSKPQFLHLQRGGGETSQPPSPAVQRPQPRPPARCPWQPQEFTQRLPPSPPGLGLPFLPECPAPHHCSALSLHVNTALIAPSLTPRAPPPRLSNSALAARHFGYLSYRWQRTCAVSYARALECSKCACLKRRASTGAKAGKELEPSRRLRNWGALDWSEWAEGGASSSTKDFIGRAVEIARQTGRPESGDGV